MEETIDINEVIILANSKIASGKQLIEQLSELEKVDGVKKLQRKVTQEVKFLTKKVNDRSIKMNHILCTNLVHFESLILVLLQCKAIKHVDYALPIPSRDSPLRIDIICDNGASWVKVIARNSKSINDAVNGRTGFGSKSILDQAEEYIEAADRNHYIYTPPKVFFVFSSEIDDDLIDALTTIGVIVKQSYESLHFTATNSEDAMIRTEFMPENFNSITTLNLDITTLLAYISALTNGSCNWDFREPLLTEQAQWEKTNPVKPILDKLFEGKKKICCETAVKSFKEIVSLLGGPQEKERANKLLEIIEILPDVTEIPEDLVNVTVGGKIKPRSFQIFSFGLAHRALTVTSNEGFIRAIKMQGIDIPVFFHEARALTELKESTATKFNL